MQSFQQVPPFAIRDLGLAGLVLGYAIVAIHNRIMDGRKWCIKIAQGCTTAGLTDLATFFTELGTGDLIDAEKQPSSGRRYERSDEAHGPAGPGGRRFRAVRGRQRPRRGHEDSGDFAERRASKSLFTTVAKGQ